jgi:hypothetical protein
MRDDGDPVTPYKENSPSDRAIWEFFSKDKGDATCNKCAMSVPPKQGCTRYLKLHLGCCHLALYKEYILKELQYIEEQVNRH